MASEDHPWLFGPQSLEGYLERVLNGGISRVAGCGQAMDGLWGTTT